MSQFKKSLRILMSTLEEIFDEAAYTRFLERTNTVSSPAAYAAFWRERETKAPKPGCC